MSRTRKMTAAAVAVAAAGLAWNGRGWLVYMWVRWRESKEGTVKEVQAK
ncbi:hypothetical protein [Actinacidiphila guanduensis]|uniref:Uncharacterized protein n=1 Tax=Actinacidiphila guanduensis TaxID=310781 RepID=A0A1H0MCD7_9ACTN|nr:hypothetical protein [Actinacidiphila guanduensis]SDO78017.1 hypothetical protein SAMN05216259_112152 [Actinacidiphila guanduensis]